MYEKLKMKVKILVGLIQVLGQFASEFNVHWNTTFFLAVSHSSSWINLDFFRWSWLACTAVGTANFYELFIVSVGLPVLLGVVAFVVPRILSFSQHCSAKGSTRKTVELLYLGYIFLIYPGLAARVVHMDRCRELFDGKNYLIADMTLDCEKSAFVTFCVCFAWIVYIIGIPVFSVFYIWWQRKTTFGGTLWQQRSHEKGSRRKFSRELMWKFFLLW
jgi:hypothetical protein